MDVLIRIFKQTFWQTVSKVVTSLSTIVILSVVARNYHEAGTGVFTLALTYLSIFSLLADFGFNAHQLRKGKFEWQKLLGTRIVWSFLLTLLAIALLPTFSFASTDFSKAVILGCLSIVASSVFISCNLIYQSKLRYDLSSLASVIGTLVGFGVFIWLSSFGFAIPFLLLANLASWIVIALLALFLSQKLQKNIFPQFDYKYSLNLLKASWPIAATLAVNVVYFRADAFIVTYSKGYAAAGIYNVAYSVFQSALVLPTFIMNAYYPLMIKTLDKMKLVALVLLGLAFLGTGSVLLLAPQIIKLISGEGFSGSIQSLQILSLSFPAFFLSSLYMWLLLAKGRYKTMLIIYIVGLVFNLVLDFIYVPNYSYIAASWVTVFCEYLILLLQIFSFMI